MSQKANAVKHAQQSEVRPHQLGQEVFKTILPEDVEWKPFPVVLTKFSHALPLTLYRVPD
jgi:hypothetical protein